MIQGPVTGGARGWPFGRPLFDLKTHGYVEEEYFLSGNATTFRQAPGTAWVRDGHWQAEAAHEYRRALSAQAPRTDTRRAAGAA